MSYLDKDYPFLLDYFRKGIKNPDKNISHCILFWGNDVEAQYELALEVARILNCKLDTAPDCNCLNCTWIRNNSHPAVLTYSKVDNKPTDDDSKTMFSIAQITISIGICSVPGLSNVQTLFQSNCSGTRD